MHVGLGHLGRRPAHPGELKQGSVGERGDQGGVDEDGHESNGHHTHGGAQVIGNLDGLVDSWITQNEPWVTAFEGHGFGTKAPGGTCPGAT